MMTDAQRYERERDHGSSTGRYIGLDRDRSRAEMEEDDPRHPSGAAIGYTLVALVTALVFGPIGFAIGRWW
jgi:hypothetical protein